MSADTPQSLPLATNHVADIADALGFSPEARTRTRDLAALADNSAALNRSPTVTAAAAAYTAGLLCNERVTQKTVGSAADCSTVAIRECYQLLIELEIATDDEDDEQRLVTDGGQNRCAHCGAILPDEIDEGTGVYCENCGHGQHVPDGGLTVDPTTDHYCAECRLVTDRPLDHCQQAHADNLDSEVDCYPIADQLPDGTWLAQPRDMGHRGPHTWMDSNDHRVCSRCDAVQLPTSPDFNVHREVATDGGRTTGPAHECGVCGAAFHDPAVASICCGGFS